MFQWKDVMAVIREVEEAQAIERRAILSELALHPPKQSSSLQSITPSDFVQHPPWPEKVVPLPIERRRRLIELYGEAFPDGRVPK